jgi:hypothetical protein
MAARPSDEPDATPVFCDVTGFTKLGWIFHFAQCARNEIYAPSQHSGLQLADRMQSDMVGLDFQTRFLLLDPLERFVWEFDE